METDLYLLGIYFDRIFENDITSSRIINSIIFIYLFNVVNGQAGHCSVSWPTSDSSQPDFILLDTTSIA